MYKVLEEICEFPIPSYEEWRKVTEKSLKGASFEKKLITHTYEGITLEPMYRQENIRDIPHLQSLPGMVPYVRGTKSVLKDKQAWEINQEIIETIPEEFNKAARLDLERGQTALTIVLDHATFLGYDADEEIETTTNQDGVSISSLEDLRHALKGIDLTKIPLYVHSGAVSLPFLSLLLAYLNEEKIPTSSIKGSIGMDPIGVLVSKGKFVYPLKECFDNMAHVTTWASNHSPELKTILVEGHPYHNGGGNAVQELAFTLATAVEYIQEMLQRGLHIDEIASKIRFAYSIGANLFMEIAKLRAARLLWSTIIDAFGGSAESQKMNIHARTSAWTKTVYDPYVNMLRGTTEAFAGAIGGADSIHVSPFDEPIQTPTPFSRRIARNTQIILQEESHLDKQIDPAGGSWYVELLTDSVAKKAWELFQSVDEKGGILKALETGFPQQHIAKTQAEKANNIEHRKDIFVGTNMYPNAEEKPLNQTKSNQEELKTIRKTTLENYRSSRNQEYNTIQVDTIDQAISIVKDGATIGEIAKAIGRGESSCLTVEPILVERGAERFERVRAASDNYYQKTGKRLQVFLANLGPIPKHKARADFSAGFFEVGGFEVIRNKGYATSDEAAEATVASKADIVVICGTDESYQEEVPKLVETIKQGFKEVTILLAGKPSEDDEKVYKNAGVDDFIHLRSNCYQILQGLLKEKGVVES